MKHDDDWNHEISLDEMLCDDLFQQMVIADKTPISSLLFLFRKIAEADTNETLSVSLAPVLRKQSY